MPEETPQLPVSEQEVQIEAPSLKDKIKLQKKKIFIGLGLFLGTLIISGGIFGAYKLGQRQTQLTPPTPTPEAVTTPMPDETAGWKTYANTNYGYSIKYPQDVTVITNEVQDSVSFKFPGEGKYAAELSIKHYHNPESLGPQSFWQKVFDEGKLEAQKNNWPPPSEPVESKAIKVNNLEGFQVRNNAYEAYQRITYLGQGETMVAISFYDENPNDPAQEEHLATFNLILSTFKFLENSETEKCLPYTDVCDPKSCDYDPTKCEGGVGQGKFVCPENDRVDCMPIVDEERKWFCSEEYLEWAKENCPKFEITY